ncbi:MAG: bifunctional 3-(3-hydroxy-phenyl)propionate/3-hydroxycinnamic acid hydroxylase [Bacteroidetes bacterium]|nr:bifunctional 3-(3-hydroxy-phenyl)propionate/3-hydroxycinnamic acid hydroxylase [Bacteroidota bacterium]
MAPSLFKLKTKPSYDIAIVGCGPVGALLANLLGRYGLHIVVLERETAAHSLPRAAHLDDEALRILQAVDVLSEALTAHRVIDGLDVVTGEGDVLFCARKAGAAEQPYGHPAATLIHQPTVEKALREGIRRYSNVDVRLGCAVEEVDDEGPFVRLRGRGPDGPFEVTASWLVGCDGAWSVVREVMESPLRGGGLEQPWLVVDVVLKEKIEIPCRLLQIADPKRPTTYVPFPDPRRRWEFMLKPGETPESMTRPETIRALLCAHIDPNTVEVERAAVYTYRDVTARGWRKGRFLIAGDAAHQMPPFLGQGLCSGFRDAHNLAWKLALVAKDAADPTLLDSYEAERRPHVQAITRLAVRMGRLIQLVGVGARIRDAAVRMLHSVPSIKRRLLNLEGNIPHIPLAFSGGRAPKPTLLPQPTVEAQDGQRTLLDAFLGDGFALIGLGVSPRSWVDADDLPTWQTLITRAVHVISKDNSWPEVTEGEVAVRDSAGVLTKWARIERGIIVVRPDRQVFGVYGADDWKMAAGGVREAVGLR